MGRSGIGIALGAGAARGLAHIGVLQVLETEGIDIHYVAGASIGSLIGAFFAAGIELDRMEQLAASLRLKHLVDFGGLPGKGGVIQGEKLRQLLNTFLRGLTFDDLRLPFAAIATDLTTGEEVAFRQGSVVTAIMASCAIPGVFVPVRTSGRILVDGGLVDRVPVRILHKMGAGKVIGVDVGPNLRSGRFRSAVEVTMQAFDIMQEVIVRLKTSRADVLIRPEVGDFSLIRLDKATELIKLGRKAAIKSVPIIKGLLAEERVQE
ncbi:MAG TPA: patatin-like phospholipase family protein [bacterium]|nr:patatin-like phospholipase family protein [bacterium]